jgi:hypothetical protein
MICNGDNMSRTQISLDKNEYDLVRKKAASLGISIAEFIRRATIGSMVRRTEARRLSIAVARRVFPSKRDTSDRYHVIAKRLFSPGARASNPVESFQNFPGRVVQRDRSPVRAGHREIAARQFPK